LRTRVLIRRLHLWLGMSLGSLFALLGVTGSALVFYVEVDAALNPVVRAHATAPAPDWDSPVWDEVLATARKRYPDRDGEWSFEVTGEGGPIPARYYPPSEHHGHHAEREMVWFSADGTKVLRVDTWGQYLMSWIYELHMHLLAGETGRLVVGWSGFAMLLLLATGTAVWWPRGSWRKALAFKRDAVPLRRLRDLHKLAGLWSLVLLFLLVLAGALLALPEAKAQLFAWSIGALDTVPEPRSGQSSGRQIPVSQALAAAHRALPDATLAFIDVPGAGAEPFRMRVRVPGDPHQRFPGSYVFVDQYSGRVLAVHDVRRGNASTWTATWIRPLHDGSIAGLGTRVLAVLVGLFPAALFATGLLHWLRRRAVRLHRKQSSHLRNRE
jgi:uncharacterized iron-regulated membrane protein